MLKVNLGKIYQNYPEAALSRLKRSALEKRSQPHRWLFLRYAAPASRSIILSA